MKNLKIYHYLNKKYLIYFSIRNKIIIVETIIILLFLIFIFKMLIKYIL